MNETSSVKPVIIITGASRGIGLGVACALAASNTPIFLTARGEAQLLRVTSFLQENGAIAHAFPCNSADEDQMAEAFRRAAQVGPIEGVLNNAGVLDPIGGIADMDIPAFEAHWRTNVTGVLVGIKQALAHRLTSHPLRIVNVSSGAATHGYHGWAAYCSSKAAVNLLTEVAAVENHPATSIVAVAPGIIETRMQRTIRSTPKDRFPDVDKFLELQQQGALLHPVHAANPLLWLLCEAPLSLSGRFVDTRDQDMGKNVPPGDETAMNRAREWFDTLESLE